jgi:Raptor N-terminal CASPase like domain
MLSRFRRALAWSVGCSQTLHSLHATARALRRHFSSSMSAGSLGPGIKHTQIPLWTMSRNCAGKPGAQHGCANRHHGLRRRSACSPSLLTGGQVQNERVLFHYNGHGVPQPTANGEIWVFNRNFTQYIPVSIHDLSSWLGQPAIYVLDCSHAGLILDSLLHASSPHVHAGRDAHSLPAASGGGEAFRSPLTQDGGAHQEIIVLAACGSDQQLPQDSDLCADIFTACLTTPIRVAMRWCAYGTSC